MTIHVDPTRFRKLTPQPPYYRYGAPFHTGEQEAIVLLCEEHRRPGAERTTSLRFVLGSDGPDGAKARHDHYVTLSEESPERFENVLDVFAPKLKADGGPFYPRDLEGKRVLVLLEVEETVSFGLKPTLVRFVKEIPS